MDLQGVERSEEFGLTDPCINCKEPRFGRKIMKMLTNMYQ